MGARTGYGPAVSPLPPLLLTLLLLSMVALVGSPVHAQGTTFSWCLYSGENCTGAELCETPKSMTCLFDENISKSYEWDVSCSGTSASMNRLRLYFTVWRNTDCDGDPELTGFILTGETEVSSDTCYNLEDSRSPVNQAESVKFTEVNCVLETDPPAAAEDCFPGSARVQLESGQIKSMAELAVGDRVLVRAVANGAQQSTDEEAIEQVFSPVVFWGHKDPLAVSDRYVRIDLSSGAEITLSRNHLAYVNGGSLVAAHHIRVGDEMTVMSDSGSDRSALRAHVVKVTHSVTAKGLFNPHTASGDIVVNGVHVSTYNAVVLPRAAHALLAVERWLFSVPWVKLSLLGPLLHKHTPLWLHHALALANKLVVRV
ncbi:Warthog protein 4 [Porphyridium purpureum]|uniref:Warthog protein 4 n=1 Tax=Porphyridium purpureum TaxID=35688 RepID=A0A5J4Z094_PORPP|nr:Warthog protein 4 [Porphyridium purpureum]|eukprot:POR6459..scf208_2